MLITPMRLVFRLFHRVKQPLMLLCMVVAGIICAHAQTITRFEYFIDADPGIGNATPASPAASSVITDFIITTPTSSLAPGPHYIHVRAQTSDLAWSPTTNFPFYIIAPPSAPASTLTQAEYFVDTDPGFGLATQVTGFSAAATITNLAIPFNTSALAPGFHKIFVRVKNNLGSWTETNSASFFIAPLYVQTNLVKFEYFFDSDPGFNKGTAVPVSPPALSVTDLSILAVPASLSVGDHIIYVRGEDANGDWTTVVSQTFSVTLPSCSAPVPTVAPVSGCANLPITITATGATGLQQYRWYDVATGGTSLASTATYSPTLSATATYYASIYDPTGNCEGSRTSVVVTVTSGPGKPTITEDGALTFCFGNSINLSAPAGFVSYLWSDANTQQTRGVSSSTSVTLTVQVKDASGCFSPASDAVTTVVLPAPAKPMVTGSTDICDGKTAVLSGPAGFTYQWSDNETTQTISVTQNSSVTLKVKDGNGCSSASSDIVVVACNDAPPAITSPTIATSVEGSISFPLLSIISDADNNLDKSTLKISKQPASGAVASIDGEYNLIISYVGIKFSGTDQLTISVCDTDAECSDKEIDVEVAGDITIYQGISPNGDNANDVFYIQYIDIIPEFKQNKVSIFNRWGDLVFDVVNYDNTNNVFKGLSNAGNLLPAGIYFYKITFNSNQKERTGYLSLKK